MSELLWLCTSICPKAAVFHPFLLVTSLWLATELNRFENPYFLLQCRSKVLQKHLCPTKVFVGQTLGISFKRTEVIRIRKLGVTLFRNISTLVARRTKENIYSAAKTYFDWWQELLWKSKVHINWRYVWPNTFYVQFKEIFSCFYKWSWIFIHFFQDKKKYITQT